MDNWDTPIKIDHLEVGQPCKVKWVRKEALLDGGDPYCYKDAVVHNISRKAIMVEMESGAKLPFKKDDILIEKKGFGVRF